MVIDLKVGLGRGKRGKGRRQRGREAERRGGGKVEGDVVGAALGSRVSRKYGLWGDRGFGEVGSLGRRGKGWGRY